MDFQQIVNDVLAFLREGFHSVNAVQGLIIALVAALLLPAWKRIWAVALGATLVHLIVDILVPVIANKAAFRLPPHLMEMVYWRHALVLYIGYVIVIAILFFIKGLFLKGGSGHH
ncbi:MAG: hypothetical protein GC166_08485 [Alphaproteobacteria bacterium]|nr:hypothetical protein [Alphaproteobacteria bacterium]